MQTILVTGGCGYIGAHTIVDLQDHGFDVVSIDNFSRSDGSMLAGIEAITGRPVKNYSVDLCDVEATRKVFEKHPEITGVIHFAAFKSVPESVSKPLLYYRNNLNSLLNILDCIRAFKIPHFVFSSSCSVYGNTAALPVKESTPLEEAESPYARSKQIGEKMITDFSKIYDGHSVLLRYFNPVGAHRSASIGELPYGKPETLVPVITQTAVGKIKTLTVFGTDYPTRDGSCIRDYIHVMDIANAHTKALQYLQAQKAIDKVEIFNLGTGKGITVLEAIKTFENISGQPLNYTLGPRRDGDVAAIYADNQKARTGLNWTLAYSLEDMMLTAWNWEKKLQNAP